jgi:hypothetical protein
MIRVDAVWLATTPLDMRAGTDMFERKSVDTFARQIRALLQRPNASDVLAPPLRCQRW